MDSDEELFIENKVRLRSSFEQLILKYSKVLPQNIEEYDLNTGQGYIIPNPLDPSLRNISLNPEDLWNFPDFKDVIPEQNLTDNDETSNISDNNSEKEEDELSYKNESDSNLLSSLDVESDPGNEVLPSEAEHSQAIFSEDCVNIFQCKDESNSKANLSPKTKASSSMTLNREFETQEDLTPRVIKRGSHQLEYNSNSSTSLKRQKSTLEYSKLDVDGAGLEIEKLLIEKSNEADSLDDIGPVLVDWKLDISYLDSESSSDEKDTLSPPQCDSDCKDLQNAPDENNTIKDPTLVCSINPSSDKKQSLPNQISIIGSTEKKYSPDSNKSEIDSKPKSTKKKDRKKTKNRKIISKSISTNTLPTTDQMDDNNESKTCDGIRCRKMFCLECDSLKL